MNPRTNETSDRDLSAPSSLLGYLMIVGGLILGVWYFTETVPPSNEHSSTTTADSMRIDTRTLPMSNGENKQATGDVPERFVVLRLRDSATGKYTSHRFSERAWYGVLHDYPKLADQNVDTVRTDKSSTSRPEISSNAVPERKTGHASLSVPETRAAIDRCALYLEGIKATTVAPDSIVGFRHTEYGIETRVWDSFSTIQKIEMNYLYAERAVPGSGEQVLARLAKALAQQYDGAKYDTALKPYLELEAGAKQNELRFEAPTPPISNTKLPAEDRSKIEALDKYLNGRQFGGASDVMQRYFPLSATEAAELLVAEGSLRKAIEHQLTTFGPPGRAGWFELVTQDLSLKYAEVLREPTLQAEAAFAKIEKETVFKPAKKVPVPEIPTVKPKAPVKPLRRPRGR